MMLSLHDPAVDQRMRLLAESIILAEYGPSFVSVTATGNDGETLRVAARREIVWA